ncbi:MAG: hypothetical protein QOF58_224, partial [Pseudonocardiales bacterium]|nr:hypothetical protein [Pseudonocardiales bacterium]
DTAPGTTPAQLPADVSGFTGREPQLAQLDGLIGGSTIVISAIAGVGGVGKTALAVHWAHQVRHHFPDGQLYVDLRGYASDHPVEPAEALSGFLHALGAEIPHDAGVASARFRSLLADKKMLVLLDNARTADQVRPLLPGTGSSLVLVTSRDSLGGLTVREGAKRLDLDMLTVDDAISLLRTLVGVRVDAEPEAARQLAAHCSRLPLALRLAAELAVSRPAAPLRELVEDLDNEQERLKLLDSAGDAHAAVGAVFSWSYRTLDPVAARVFGLLGHIPGPDIGLDALVSFTGLPAGELRLVLRALEHAHWIEQHRRGRYRMHDVVRLYAAAQITPAEDDVRRVVDHYLRVAHAGDRLLDPLRPPIDLAPLTDQPVPAIDSIGQAMRWFDAEHDCVIGAQHLAVERGWYLQVYQLGWSLTCYHIRRGDWARNLEVTRVSFQAAKLHGDPALELRARRQLGGISGRVGRYEESVEHLRACLAMAEQSGDPTGQLPFIHSNLSTVHEANGRMREALAEGQIALEMFRRANLPDWINELMNIVGWQHAYLGEYDEARALCEQSLARNTALGNEVYIAANLDALGYIAHHVGDHQAAIRYFTDAIETLERTSYLERQARALRRLSEACRAAGKVEEGDEAERRAAELELALKG